MKMRKNLGAQAMLYPMPVLIIGSYDENGTPDAMNAAWGGISEETQISICIDCGHKTAKNVVCRGAFTVSIADEKNVVACDYVGIVSGNDVPDKFTKAGFHHTRSSLVNAPIIDELPMTLECKLVSYDENTCRLIGEIVNVSADVCVLDEKGRIAPEKLKPITFDPSRNEYLVIGEKVGNAFSDGLKLK
jgi:flavin reductase (DIM6/NTAB) family NADH-FMN oxidoreductase RutF